MVELKRRRPRNGFDSYNTATCQRLAETSQSNRCSMRFALTAAVFGSLFCQSSSGFGILAPVSTREARAPSRLWGAQSSSTTEETVQLKPRTSTSDEKRRQAYNAMKRSEVETALTGIDAQMLQLLSDQFLYPTNGSSQAQGQRKRPKGRPDYVPGAMNFETMAKFRERQDVLDMVNDAAVSDEEIAAIAPYLSSEIASNQATNGATQPEVSNDSGPKVKGKTDRPDAKDLPIVGQSNVSVKKRRPVVKNLPSPRQQSKKEEKSKSDFQYTSNNSFSGRRSRKGNNMDLQKYYGTELLTADEEYALGMKIQFMIKCEQVHEGLATKLMRLPTIEEWAMACGFTDPDPLFVATEADEQLRPAGSESLFETTDPNMFVGNGLAQDSGPGRGRGRAKKPPPLKLVDFYDDSEYQAARKKNDKSDKTERIRKKDLKPINRGTATNFVEMMMTSREAKQQMVQSNMRLVVSIARKYSNVGVSLQDLVQEGSLGLSRAAEKFDPKKGFKFSTYASWWIQQAVFRSIAYHSRTIRLPVHVHNLLNRIRKVRSALHRDLGRSPTNDEIAEKLGMTVQKYNKMLRLTKRSISLETPKYKSNPKDLGHESDDLLGDTIASSNVLLDETTPEAEVDQGLFHDDLREMLEILEDDEKRVICARYGLSDGLTRTVTAVAAQMKQSKAWVRSQECRALRKLRRPWYEKKLREHQDALTG